MPRRLLVRADRQADPVGRYLVADAARLPFADRSFSVVVACNSLMDIDDMADAVAEAARVLTRDGRFWLVVERLREPPWPEDELSPWRHVPNFLFLRARLG